MAAERVKIQARLTPELTRRFKAARLRTGLNDTEMVHRAFIHYFHYLETREYKLLTTDPSEFAEEASA